MKEVIGILAVVVSPVIAVLITKYLQNKENKRKDKIEIFKTLMTGRIYGWDIASVHALNIIEIVFSEDKNVISQWKNYYNAACTDNYKNIKIQQTKLLEEIGKALGYKDKISWESIEKPYIPRWLDERMEQEKKYVDGQVLQAEAAKMMKELLEKVDLPFLNKDKKE